MSSSRKKSGGDAVNQLVTLETCSLKERLNNIYSAHRKEMSDIGSFRDLWDLKEKALLEGKQSIEVPRMLLDELEGALADSQLATKH